MNNLAERIIDFFKKMLSDSGEISSKRVVGFGSFVLIAIAVIVNLCGGTIIATFIFDGLIGLIISCFIMNTILSAKAAGISDDKQKTEEVK